MVNEDVAAACGVVVATMLLAYQVVNNENKGVKRKRNRKVWTKPWIDKRNQGTGCLNLLQNELRVEDPVSYKNYLRMDHAQFIFVLGKIRCDLVKSDTVMREAISPEKRLAVTLRFLATGETFRSLMYSTRIHESTIGKIIPEVCKALYKNLGPEFLKTPKRAEQWKKIAADYQRICHFPNCLGAIDGKHINFRPSRSDGSYYFNYKGHHSIVLLAVADANFKFVYVDVGVNGRISDGGVFRESSLSRAIQSNSLDFPANQCLDGRKVPVPYVFIGDDAFPMMERLMKPFPQRGLSREKRIYNYRLCSARRVVENAFGILANRFRIFLSTINLSADKVEDITLAACVLHNYLLTGANRSTIGKESVQGTVLNSLQPLRTVGKVETNTHNIRAEFSNYFNSEIGSVPWQNEKI